MPYIVKNRIINADNPFVTQKIPEYIWQRHKISAIKPCDNRQIIRGTITAQYRAQHVNYHALVNTENRQGGASFIQ